MTAILLIILFTAPLWVPAIIVMAVFTALVTSLLAGLILALWESR